MNRRIDAGERVVYALFFDLSVYLLLVIRKNYRGVRRSPLGTVEMTASRRSDVSALIEKSFIHSRLDSLSSAGLNFLTPRSFATIVSRRTVRARTDAIGTLQHAMMHGARARTARIILKKKHGGCVVR